MAQIKYRELSCQVYHFIRFIGDFSGIHWKRVVTANSNPEKPFTTPRIGLFENVQSSLEKPYIRDFLTLCGGELIAKESTDPKPPIILLIG